MDSRKEQADCRCGRRLIRWVTSYELGRRGSMPYRMIDRWRHEDDNSLGCEYDNPLARWADATKEFPDTM